MKIAEIENMLLLELPPVKPKKTLSISNAKDDALAKQTHQLKIQKKQQQLNKTKQREREITNDITKLRNPTLAKPTF